MKKLNAENRIRLFLVVLGTASSGAPVFAANDCNELNLSEERAACHYGYGKGFADGQAGTIGQEARLVSAGTGYGLLVPSIAGSAGDMGAPVHDGPGTEGFEILYIPIGNAGSFYQGGQFFEVLSAAGEAPWSQVLTNSAINDALAAAQDPVSIQLFKDSGMFVQRWDGSQWGLKDKLDWKTEYEAAYDTLQSVGVD